MIGLLQKFFGGDRVARRDAASAYGALMAHSRNPGWYRPHQVPDTFQGRAELLLLHVAIVMKICLRHGENGKALQQALFDHMKDDFDVALREEGYSDTGVKHRIKPLIQLFYQTAQQYFEALDQATDDELLEILKGGEGDVDGLGEASAAYRAKLAHYVRAFHEDNLTLSLGDIAQGRFRFPDVPIQ